MTQKIVGGIGALLLLGLTWTGISGFVDQVSVAEGTGQVVQTYSQLVYGVGALLSIVTTTWGKRWADTANRVFLGGIAVAGGFAPVVYGDAAIWTGLLTGMASLAVGICILWLLRRGFPSK